MLEALNQALAPHEKSIPPLPPFLWRGSMENIHTHKIQVTQKFLYRAELLVNRGVVKNEKIIVCVHVSVVEVCWPLESPAGRLIDWKGEKCFAHCTMYSGKWLPGSPPPTQEPEGRQAVMQLPWCWIVPGFPCNVTASFSWLATDSVLSGR